MKLYKIKGGGTIRIYVSSESAWREERELHEGEYTQLHELPIPYEVSNKNKPKDFIDWDGILVSKELKAVLEPLCKSAEFLPAQIYYYGEKIYDERYVAVFPAFEALSYEHSEIRWHTVKKENDYIYEIKKLVVSQEKMDRLPADEGVFYLKEHKVNNLIAAEAVKEAVTKTKLTGMTFIELESVNSL